MLRRAFPAYLFLLSVCAGWIVACDCGDDDDNDDAAVADDASDDSADDTADDTGDDDFDDDHFDDDSDDTTADDTSDDDDTGDDSSDDDFDHIVLVKTMTFSGTDFTDVRKDCSYAGCPKYGTPHWKDNNGDGDADDLGENRFPVSYVRNATVSIKALAFTVTPADLELSDVPVRGEGPDGLTFTGTGTLSGGNLTVSGTLPSDVALPNAVKYYDAFTIDWEVALDGATYQPAGSTSNVLFATLDGPIGTPIESFFTISTIAADGTDNSTDAIDAIWNEFTDRHVENAQGEVMGYYRDILCASYCYVYDAYNLVMQLNGQCGSWADLLMLCFDTQGLGGSQFVTIEPSSYSDYGILVNDYEYLGTGTSGCSSYPFKFNSPCGESEWPTDPEVTDLSGLAGQDEPNPASYFGRHFIVKMNGKYYDPSYGAGPFEGTRMQANLAWEQGAMAGYFSYCGYYIGARKDVYASLETSFDL